MIYDSKIELSKSKLKSNLSFIRTLLGPNVEFCSVVKANAYGHGLQQFTELAQSLGVTCFSVSSADEAFLCRKHLDPNTRLIVMGPTNDDAIEWAIQSNVELFAIDLPHLELILKKARKLENTALVHLDLETGMHRIGLAYKDLPEAARLIREAGTLCSIKGATTHLAGPEDRRNEFRVLNQLKSFEDSVDKLSEHGISPLQLHAACSAASVTYPQSRYDLARIGIMQYGSFSNTETLVRYVTANNLEKDPLQRIISWKTSVRSIRSVKSGEYIGYGTSFRTARDMKIGVLPVGYSHGFSRGLSNYGQVLVKGRRTPVIGTVNMNMMTIDITDIPDVDIGDSVILIGNQGEESIGVSSFSDLSNLLNYESLVRLPADIPRVVVD